MTNYETFLSLEEMAFFPSTTARQKNSSSFRRILSMRFRRAGSVGTCSSMPHNSLHLPRIISITAGTKSPMKGSVMAFK